MTAELIDVRPKRGRPRDDGTTTAMYIDYCTGMSIPEVAVKWGRGRRSVYRRFHGMRLPIRREVYAHRGRPTGVTRNPQVFTEANRERSRRANLARVPEAQRLLPLVTCERQRRALMARIEFPYASLTELGALLYPPVSKDTVAGLLRRARETHL